MSFPSPTWMYEVAPCTLEPVIWISFWHSTKSTQPNALEHMGSIHLCVRNWRHTAVSQYHSWHHNHYHHHAHHQISKDTSTFSHKIREMRICHSYPLKGEGDKETSRNREKTLDSPLKQTWWSLNTYFHCTTTTVQILRHEDILLSLSLFFPHGTTHASLGLWVVGTLGIKLCSPRPPSGCDVNQDTRHLRHNYNSESWPHWRQRDPFDTSAEGEGDNTWHTWCKQTSRNYGDQVHT